MQNRYGKVLLLCAVPLFVQGTKTADVDYKVFADSQAKALETVVDPVFYQKLNSVSIRDFCSNDLYYVTNKDKQPLEQTGDLNSAFLKSVARMEGSLIYPPSPEDAILENFGYLYDVANLCLFTALIFNKVKTPKKFSPIFTIKGGASFINKLLFELEFNYGSFATKGQKKIQEAQKCVVAHLRQSKEQKEPSDLWLGNENFNTFVFCMPDGKTMQFWPCKTVGESAAKSLPNKPADAQFFELAEIEMLAATAIAASKNDKKVKTFKIGKQKFTLGGIFAICLVRLLSKKQLVLNDKEIQDLALIKFLQQVQKTIKDDVNFKYGRPVVRYFTEAIFTNLVK